jgi:hypothetical protein
LPLEVFLTLFEPYVTARMLPATTLLLCRAIHAFACPAPKVLLRARTASWKWI